MFRSMTGYGKASASSPIGNFSIEIQSVNRKFLEININCPRELSFLNHDIRKLIESEVFGGQISVTIKGRFEDKLPYKVVPNITLAKEIFEASLSIIKELQLQQETLSLQTLLSERSDLFLFESNPSSEEEFRLLILKLTKSALDQFITMREVEGRALKEDFLKRLDLLQINMNKIKELALLEPEKLKQKLLTKLQENFANALDNEERMMREMMIFCEKVDVQEEIIRFYSHLNQFRDFLKGSKGGIGKKLDFLSQEIARELNTLGAKTNDLQITQLVVEMKTELSRIREQLQNVE
jgi:uncharacterized protein (TIGR00255 family)